LIVAVILLWPAPAGSVAERVGPPAVDVKIERLAPIAQRDEIRLPAVLEPYRTIKVAAEVPGRIEKLGPKEGTEVEPNQPLAWLNGDLIQAAYDQALAKNQLDLRELNRYESLDDRGAATDIEMFRARAAAEISKAVLKEVGERLKRTVIRAPMAGVLNDMLVEPGEYVTPGSPVAEIVEMDRLKAVVNLPERDVVYAHVGEKVRLLVDSVVGLELSGEVTFIDACGDQKCRTFRTEITVDNAQRRARAGLIVRAVLLRKVIDEAIMIPLASVIPTETGYQVYVVEDGKASQRPVEIGIIVGDRVQVKKGLKGGDELIVDGHRLVGDGTHVNVVR
jgi:membrane fusion protein (multidrug efflux system)